MKGSLVGLCAVLLSLAAAVSQERLQNNDSSEDGVGGLEDAAGAAELSVLSEQNSSGHWLAKVRLLHAAGAAAEGAQMQPVHLQLQRSAHAFSDGGRTVALEATLSGKGDLAATETSERGDGAAHHGRCTRGLSGCPASTRSRRQPCPPACAPLPPLPTPASIPTSPVPPTAAPSTRPPPPPPPPLPIHTCPPPQTPVPPGYTFYPGLGHYKVHLTPVTWFEAKATCEREGAYLAVINSKEEANMVANFHIQYNIPHELLGIRVGFHDLLVEGTYYTVLGQLLSDSGFTEWHPAEPNSAGGEEDCGSLYWTAQLNDVSCFCNGTFVCELPSYQLL
ncbi:hypothetical protein R5R35_002827 [Gryllus longicercus]|uniref:C-type lectin domain-containing protein n=1 Tax=Gryllus longicercus TaxID=2509291 RepID=A0AAN9VMN7_9ORTH